jgi:hypothetical protein
MGDELTGDDLTESTGISRREMLRRSAVVGGAGALMWAAPSVTTFAPRAFGATAGTPDGKDFSYIALAYMCPQNAVRRTIKFEFGLDANGQPTVTKCERGDFKTPLGGPGNPQCTFTTGSAGPVEDCQRFSFTYVNGLKTIQVCADTPCVIEGVGVGKCGSSTPQSGGECVYTGTAGGTTSCLPFELCGA